MNQATVLQCHQSQSQSCVCGKSGVEVAMVAMPHTHHDACDEPPIPTTHSSVSVCVQTVDMEVVAVLVMAMECDGAFMVTITTLVSCHSLTHSEEGDGKRDSGGFTPPHNTIKWWLVGVAGVQAKWMMSAKKGGPHTKWMNHTTQNTTLPNQSPFYHSPIPCPHTPIHVPSAPTLASSNATTTPSTTNKKKKEEGLMVAQKNKWTPPQKQGNTMGTCMAGLV